MNQAKTIATSIAAFALSTGIAFAGCGVFSDYDRGGMELGMNNNTTVKFMPEGSAILRQINGTYAPEFEGQVSHIAVSDDCRAIVYGIGDGAPGHDVLTGHSNLADNLNDKVAAMTCECQ